ncbi:tryptophan 2,3-dioxygenase family protein [Micromonospora sp. WMMC250]|uniref:tryptophan 2,3-dioxygenase family protein n=1 Tax=Micromonospora sp. WMMC250 TaxID=3014781 RepID=UPI0022B6A470|nr:tryptophan 2,3-dioxygenase family protein [Micromonospora sp. WMMC250]MCZ7379788.1 tryptophan 2,3-dioxygenase family protein [Micromonospora sp. WMMC250]
MTSAQPLHRWLAQRRPSADRFPFDAVATAYQHYGKHFIPDEWTQALIAARDRLPQLNGARTTYLSAFLSGALDKIDGTFDYRSYLGLALLPIPDASQGSGAAAQQLANRDRLHAILLTDLIAFELRAAHDDQAPLPQLRPTPAVAAKRLRHALRAVMPALRRLSFVEDTTGPSEIAQLRRVTAAVDVDLTAEDRRALQVSMLPVHTMHDEWMFIRVLQAFETTFALLATDLTEIINAVQASRMPLAATRLSAAASLLRESASLWPLLATIQPEAFHAFRPYTDGASAIQSRHYKMLESLCRTPDGKRLNSPAYLSVPEVRTAIMQGQVSLDDALAAAQQSASTDIFLTAAMREFTAAITQWRQTHYRLAVRVLGPERSGTGYTQGTPYLHHARSEPVFRHRPPADPDAGVDG